MSIFKVYLELAKVRITIFVSLTTVFGFICAFGNFNFTLLGTCLGLFLLASGSAAFNHFQERKFDALMNRTKRRPIPSGIIPARDAFIFASALSVIGSVIIFLAAGTAALLLSLLALVWYNVIYTPMKRKSAWAIIPGSLIGAIPPAVGWVAAGGNLFDPVILVIAAFFFIWQIPHFWLLLLIYNDEYDEAGYPTLTKLFSREQLSRLTFLWIIAAIATAAVFPFFNVMKFSYAAVAILFVAMYVLVGAVKILKPVTEKKVYFNTFMKINGFVVAVVFFISLEKLLISV